MNEVLDGLLCLGITVGLLSLCANYIAFRILMVGLEKFDLERLKRERAEAALKTAQSGVRASSLSAEEITRLLRLCHPDLHPVARQAEATALTARLNALRTSALTRKSGRRT